MDVAGQWREGVLYPRWAELSNWGFGEPRFIFYPPLSWTIGAMLGSLLPWNAVPGAYVWLVLIVAGMVMWRFARDSLSDAQSAAAAVFFTVNPYNLAMVYYRSDFAELLGVALLPLLLCAALRVMASDWRRVPHLAVVFAAIWLANAPEGVIATYSLALIFLISTLRQRRAQPLISGAIAMLTGFGLAAFYILPAAWERGWVQISQALGKNLRPVENFLFTHSSDAAFQLFNWKISAVALGTMLATALAVPFAIRRRHSLGRVWWMLLGLAIASSLAMLPLSAPLWRHLPELAFLQFPWRWLGPLSVAFAFFTAVAIFEIRPGRNRAMATLGILSALVVTGALIGATTWWNSDDAALIGAEIRSGHGYEGVDEYEPLGEDRYALPNATPDAEQPPVVPATPPVEIFDANSGKLAPAPADVKITVEKWAGERKLFGIEARLPVTLALRLVGYPSWEVQVDGRLARTGLAPETDQMLLPLTPGEHRVQIRFRRTPDRAAGDAISIFSAVGLLAFAWIQRKRGRKASIKVAGA